METTAAVGAQAGRRKPTICGRLGVKVEFAHQPCKCDARVTFDRNSGVRTDVFAIIGNDNAIAS
jgi:hypothetical protein